MRPTTKELVTFALLGALMYASKFALAALPNIHLIGLFLVSITLVYRAKALYPLYLFVLLCGIFDGFSLWWISYLYVWTVLWGAVMLIPRRLSVNARCAVGLLLSGMHGLLFGVLSAPAQAVLFGLDFQQTVAWVAAGLPFDMLHGLGNLACGLLILPLTTLLGRLAATQKP